MSLFGKILALFNIIGAIALFCLAAMDYGKRQAWSFSVLRHEMVMNGLPLDEKEEDKQGKPLVEKLDPEKSPTLDAMFSGLGNPVRTQLEEVTRIQGLVNTRIDAAPKGRAQTFLLSRALLPVTDNYLEREELLACQTYLLSDDTLKQWKARYQEALDLALAQMGKRTFEEAFQVAIRSRPGEPSVAFTSLMLAQLPAKGDEVKNLAEKKLLNLDAVFDKALDAQQQSLKTRLAARFDRVKVSTDVPRGQEGQAIAAQKQAIARLLFALCPFLAEEAAAGDLKGLDPISSAFADKVLQTEPFKTATRRVYLVSGLKVTLSAISEEADVQRKLGTAVIASQRQEQVDFVGDNLSQIEDLRDWAGRLEVEKARIEDNKRKLAEQMILVKTRQLDVERLEMELKESRAQTADALVELRKVSEEVRLKRVELRDAIRSNEEAEKKIRDLEAFIRSRERK